MSFDIYSRGEFKSCSMVLQRFLKKDKGLCVWSVVDEEWNLATFSWLLLIQNHDVFSKIRHGFVRKTKKNRKIRYFRVKDSSTNFLVIFNRTDLADLIFRVTHSTFTTSVAKDLNVESGCTALMTQKQLFLSQH